MTSTSMSTATSTIEIGVVGLGRMGGGLALQALEKKMRVVGLDSGAAAAELRAAGLVEVGDVASLAGALAPPRAVFLYVPAGDAVDQLLARLVEVLAPGDVIADGGNSYWGDSIRRGRRLLEAGIHLVDLGTSGGPTGARHGACFMAGGARAAVARLEPVLRQLAVVGGYVHAGPSGAGHFAKLVHNGIEYGMLQAIGEGVALLERYRDHLDLPAVIEAWRHGSVIRSWLMDLLHEALVREGGLESVPAYVEDTGEVSWLVDDAMNMEVPAPVIATAVMQLITSRDKRETWARAIAMMRHGFGGHPYGTNDAVARERHTGRVGPFPRP
jgi:6-phosphogluconate dehydrogenase